MTVTLETLEIGPDRGDLEVPPLAEGEEWAAARLTLEAAPTVSFSPPMEAPGDPEKGVSWVSVDWDRQRPLTGVHLTTKELPDGVHAMLKVATGGIWFTPTPPGRLHTDLYQPIFAFKPTAARSFPAVTASAALVEFNAADPFEGAALLPVLAMVTDFTVIVLNPVIDLSVRVGDRQLAHQQKGRLKQKLELDLLEFIRAAAPGSPVQLRAAQAAEVKATLTLERVRRPAAAPAEPAQQAVAFNEAARWTQDIPAEEPGSLAQVSGRVEWAVQPQRVLLEPSEALVEESAQLLTPARRVAQVLPALGAVIGGVDIWLRSAEGCRGRLTLYGEARGRPAGEPLSVSEWSMDAGVSGWVGAELDAALAEGLPEPTWAVLELDEGRAFAPRTSLDAEATQEAEAAQEAELPAALEARGQTPWAELETYTDAAPRPHLRLRLREHLDEGPTGQVTVSRGAESVSLTIPSGAFSLSEAQLTTLNKPAGALTITASAPGVGEVSLSDWVVRFA